MAYDNSVLLSQNILSNIRKNAINEQLVIKRVKKKDKRIVRARLQAEKLNKKVVEEINEVKDKKEEKIINEKNYKLDVKEKTPNIEIKKEEKDIRGFIDLNHLLTLIDVNSISKLDLFIILLLFGGINSDETRRFYDIEKISEFLKVDKKYIYLYISHLFNGL